MVKDALARSQNATGSEVEGVRRDYQNTPKEERRRHSEKLSCNWCF